ncbi:hypothetical protein Pelo_495 [Pelomyxa schiedti]|nr:hypothetical protein Pelo_495 [Pelomyxa schiedti]
MEPTAKRPRTDQQTPQNQLQQHTTTENNAALHKQQKHDGDVHVTPPTPIDGISGSGSVSVSGSSGDDGKLLPYNDTTDHRVLLSASYKCELVSSSVKGAFAYLNNLAADAETSAIAATADVDSTVNLLGSTMMTMISSKVEELKAEIQANLQSSLNQLKSLNTSEYLRNQRLICPKERLLNAFGKLLNDISILQGTHILDLPLAVLSMIIGYLPAQGVISTRAVCFKLWDAVRTGVKFPLLIFSH